MAKKSRESSQPVGLTSMRSEDIKTRGWTESERSSTRIMEKQRSDGYYWQDVITALGVDAVLLAAAGWLIKSLVSNSLAKELRNSKVT